MHRALVVLAAAASLVVSGCDVPNEPAAGTDADRTRPPSPTARDTEPGTGDRSSSCVDVTGDGGLADIREVDLAENSDGLRVTFRLSGPPVSSTGTVLLSVTAWSRDGDIGRQLGMKWANLDFTAFVFDVSEGRQEDVPTQPVIDGDTVTVTFPATATDELGSPWLWTATTTTNGADVDECPDENAQAPVRLSFPQ